MQGLAYLSDENGQLCCAPDFSAFQWSVLISSSWFNIPSPSPGKFVHQPPWERDATIAWYHNCSSFIHSDQRRGLLIANPWGRSSAVQLAINYSRIKPGHAPIDIVNGVRIPVVSAIQSSTNWAVHRCILDLNLQSGTLFRRGTRDPCGETHLSALRKTWPGTCDRRSKLGPCRSGVIDLFNCPALISLSSVQLPHIVLTLIARTIFMC